MTSADCFDQAFGTDGRYCLTTTAPHVIALWIMVAALLVLVVMAFRWRRIALRIED